MQKTPEYAFDAEGHTVVVEPAKKEDEDNDQIKSCKIALYREGRK
jgi:hypothetical protein